MDWITNKLPEEKDSVFAKLYGTDKWNDAMFKKTSDTVLVTIECNDDKFVTTASTRDGVWRNNYLRLYKDAKVVAWMPFPDPYNEV